MTVGLPVRGWEPDKKRSSLRADRLLARDDLSTTGFRSGKEKAPRLFRVSGLRVWWSRGDLNPKLQYPGQIKASAHYAGNLDLLDCSQ
jgi:hypothetical protein